MQYNPALDGVRAIAALAVVASHCRVPLLNGGLIGVDVFFVLSGYLITSILRAEAMEAGTVSLRRFYWRRALRLWPPLLLMLVGYAALAPSLLPPGDMVADVALAATYLTDYALAFWRTPVNLSHTWSLSVEEHFYLIWPLVILATRSFSRSALLRIFAMGFVAATVWRIADASIWGDWVRTYYRFDTRMSGLMLGGLIAVSNWRPPAEQAAMIGRLSVYVLIAALVTFRFKVLGFTSWGGIIVDLAAAGLILSLISGEATGLFRALSRRGVVYLGKISYSIYLWHFPITLVVRGQVNPVAAFLAVSVLSIAIAALSYEFLEKPMKSIRRRQAPEGAM